MSIEPRYPLEGTVLDVPLEEILTAPAPQRHQYVLDLLDAFSSEIEKDTMALKSKVSFERQLRDLGRVNSAATDEYLFTDEKKRCRNVLGKGAPGGTHTDWSRHKMWRMRTKIGDLEDEIRTKSPKLVNALNRFFDPNNGSKDSLRHLNKTAVENALNYLQMQMGSGSAFPPFHARFFADKWLPQDRDCVVVDPCAGWGGRAVGCLLVPRTQKVTFYGVDPEQRNKAAYEGLSNLVTEDMKDDLWGPRETHFSFMPFEDWLGTDQAKGLFGNVDLVITSPPYASAENYNPDNPNQSANRYPTYDQWRNGFLNPLIKGSYALLKPGGHFVLNIANVQEAPRLEDHANTAARRAGFERAGFYHLALARSPGNRNPSRNIRLVTVDGVPFKREPVFCMRKPLMAANDNEMKLAA